MKIFHLLLALMVFTAAHSQTIEGVVLDKDTKEPLINANVYFNGTFKGTTTDTLGHFTLNSADHPNHALVVSTLGYYSESLFEYNSDEFITILLDPKTLEIDKVLVIFNKTEAEKLRKKGLKRFKKEFLGNTYNARKCEILNLQDVKIKFSEDQKSFEAYANKPILIYNAALGYSITYHLGYFGKGADDLSYQGTYFYVEDTTKRKRQTRKMIQRREQTYRGSRMHFFRSLYENNTDEEGFIIHDSLFNIVPSQNIISEIENQSRFLTYKGELSYLFFPNHNNKAYFTASNLYIEADSVLFTKDGYFDPKKIIWSGKAAKRRVGDLLPFEYKVE